MIQAHVTALTVEALMLTKLHRLNAVIALTGLSRPTIYRKVGDKTFPAPVKISSRAVAWREEDLALWLRQVAGPRAGEAA